MIFKLACGDIMPGCSTRFESSDRTDLMNDVARHAADAHGISTITPDVLTAIEGRIQTIAS
jgi:predicted small metal-binding protein